MKIRLAGLALIGLGVLTGVYFVHEALGSGGRRSGVGWAKGVVFVPLAVLTGVSFLVGGAPALEAFQARPRSRGQLAFVLGIIVGSAVLSGLGYRQLKIRTAPAAPEIIRDFRGKPPEFKDPRPVTP
ncbi:MAG: hypothetical protein AB7L66_08525 [Gemmatimonadales bacterium]